MPQWAPRSEGAPAIAAWELSINSGVESDRRSHHSTSTFNFLHPIQVLGSGQLCKHLLYLATWAPCVHAHSM